MIITFESEMHTHTHTKIKAMSLSLETLKRKEIRAEPNSVNVNYLFAKKHSLDGCAVSMQHAYVSNRDLFSFNLCLMSVQYKL